MKNTLKFALVGAFLAVAAPVASAADAQKVSQQTTKEVTAQPKAVLSIVKKLVSAHKDNACEIVKAAIVATEADKNLVAAIVETAIKAAPTKVSLITTCALAVAPDAYAQVQKIEAKHAKNTGTSPSAKGSSAKGSSAKGGAKDAGLTQQQDLFGNPLNLGGASGTGLWPATQNTIAPVNGGAATPGSSGYNGQ